MPVDPLISADDFLERFDITDIDANRITPHIGSASRRLRKWVGETTYASADEEVRSDLKNAEAHLAFHYALLGMQFAVSSKGSVVTSMSAEGKEMRKFLLPKEAAELSNYFLELAREIAEPYALSDGTPGASFEITEDEDDA